MKTIRTMMLAGIFAVAGCASSPETASVEQDAKNAPAVAETTKTESANDKNKMRCKRVKRVGSHRTTLQCTSPQQDADEARHTQDMARRNQVRNSACVGCGGDG